jgi:hypothetical protein
VFCISPMNQWKSSLGPSKLTFQKLNKHLSKPEGDQDPPNNGGLLESTILAEASEICYSQEQRGNLKKRINQYFMSCFYIIGPQFSHQYTILEG